MMKALLTSLTLSILLASVSAAADALRTAEHAIQGREFGKAVTLLDGHLSVAGAARADYATYLKALALYHDGKDQAAVAACDTLLASFDKSDWNRKALYLKSRALVRMKMFEQAEAIYEAEANRLFSADRKKGLANVLVEFGDELSRKPGKDELEAPAPDYDKALQLYNKALGLEIGRELRDVVLFKIARSHHQLSNWAEAKTRYRAYLKEFDPKWSGPVGSPERFRGRVRENPFPAGQHWKDARFHLVEVQLGQSGQSVQVVAGLRHQALQGLNGSATVIARQEGRYAFYRGTTHLGQPVAPNAQPVPQEAIRRQQLQQKDFLQNLDISNDEIQSRNIKGWDAFRRQKGGKGVEVKEAF